SSAADCQGRGENGSTRLRSSGRTVADCAAADLQNTRGNLRGCDADNCESKVNKNKQCHVDCIDFRFARRNYSSRNSRATSRFARARSAVVSAVLSGLGHSVQTGCAEDSALSSAGMLSLHVNLVSFRSDPQAPAWRNWQTRWTQNPVIA